MNRALPFLQRGSQKFTLTVPLIQKLTDFHPKPNIIYSTKRIKPTNKFLATNTKKIVRLFHENILLFTIEAFHFIFIWLSIILSVSFGTRCISGRACEILNFIDSRQCRVFRLKKAKLVLMQVSDGPGNCLTFIWFNQVTSEKKHWSILLMAWSLD